MPGKRSPNCPAHDLEESIDKVIAIYRNEGRNSFSGSDAVIHMGYNGLNGASRRALGAVRAFGLVEGRGEQLKVSDDAVLIIADVDAEDQRERKQALLRSLCNNRVFCDLYETFADGSTLSQLSGYLQKKYRFKPLTADYTAEVFHRSVSMLQIDNEDTGRFETGLNEKVNSLVGVPVRQLRTTDQGLQDDSVGPEQQVRRPVETRQDSFTVDNGTVFLRWPIGMSTEEFEDFTDWLILEHRKIARSIKGDDGPVIELCRKIHPD